MAQKLTDSIVKSLASPATGNRIEYNSEVKGFGCRVTAAGVRSFVLNYRTKRRARAALHDRAVPGVADDGGPEGGGGAEEARRPRWGSAGEHRGGACGADRRGPLRSAMRPSTFRRSGRRAARDDLSMIAAHILPAMKHKKVADVVYSDIDALHRKVTASGASYRANRVVALSSKMFSLAVRWQWRTDNPAKGIERNQEVKRHRYLGGDELGRLTAALAEHPDQQAANIIRLLLLTGARSAEVRSARWEDFDLTAGVWTKPGATTKQKTEHRVPLSAPARQLLAELWAAAERRCRICLSRADREAIRTDIRRAWETFAGRRRSSRRACTIFATPTPRCWRARTSRLPTIGALLGHTQPQTTARYAHLFDDPLRAATERVGAIVTGRQAATVVPLKGGAA